MIKWVSFLGSLHWPAHGGDLGVGGVSYVELLILYELWAGERLVLEKAHPRYLRPGRPISVSAVPFGPGTDIWRSCRFIGALMRSLCLLPGGLERLFLALLALITVGFGTLAGNGVVMVLLPVLVRALLLLFWISFYLSFIIPLGRLLLYLLVLFLSGIVLSSLLLRLLFGFCLFLVMFLGSLLYMIGLLLMVFRLSVVALGLEESDFD